MTRARDAKVWNEDLVRAMRAREYRDIAAGSVTSHRWWRRAAEEIGYESYFATYVVVSVFKLSGEARER
eukprot:1179190-Prorocentrum_minimum.AAC.1